MTMLENYWTLSTEVENTDILKVSSFAHTYPTEVSTHEHEESCMTVHDSFIYNIQKLLENQTSVNNRVDKVWYIINSRILYNSKY